MLGFCPDCEKETKIEEILVEEEFNIRGELIRIETKALKCTENGHIFDDPSSTDDYLDRAYREFRSRKNLMQPEEIREARKSYGLSQRELNALLGWGGATLSRYENGALQSESHDKLLHLIKGPGVLLSLIEAAPDAINEEKREILRASLKSAAESEHSSLLSHYESSYASKSADKYSGYIPFDASKVRNAFIFLCQAPGVFKTKLNKLLFYADFKHCKQFESSITGLRYAHLPFGPVPDQYIVLLAALTTGDEPSIEVQEQRIGDYIGEICRALINPDLSVFSQSEIMVLASVNHRFSDATASLISEDSHREDGYTQTNNGELISYEYAKSLSI